MSPLLRPVGPLPASVYWVRRVILLVPLVLAVWFAGASVVPDGAVGRPAAQHKDAANHPTPTPLAGPGARATPTPAPGGASRTDAGTSTPIATSDPAGGTPAEGTTPASPTTTHPGAEAETPPPQVSACGPDLAVTTSTAKGTVPAGTPLAVLIEVRNRSSQACLLTLTTSTFRLQITSGSDLIWDTAHCPVEPPREPLRLEPGATRGLTLTWPGVRSREGCPPGQPAALPGYYVAHASVGGGEPARDRFRLT